MSPWRTREVVVVMELDHRRCHLLDFHLALLCRVPSPRVPFSFCETCLSTGLKLDLPCIASGDSIEERCSGHGMNQEYDKNFPPPISSHEPRKSELGGRSFAGRLRRKHSVTLSTCSTRRSGKRIYQDLDQKSKQRAESHGLRCGEQVSLSFAAPPISQLGFGPAKTIRRRIFVVIVVFPTIWLSGPTQGAGGSVPAAF